MRDGTHDTPKYIDSGYPLITSKNLTSSGTINFDDISYISEDDFNFINKRSNVDTNDILFGMIGTIGNPVLVGNDTNFAIKNVALIKKSDSINQYFLINILNSNIFKKYIIKTNQGNTQKFISLSQIRKFTFYAPQLYEQIEIGKILQKIDSVITLYERKTRLLGKVRTFLTQRLFSNSSKVSLYFDNKNWSEHKISEFLTERNEKVVPNSSIPLVSFTVEKGVTPKSKRYNREFLVKDDNKKYKITKKDDIVYNPANLKFGAIARNKFGNAAFSPIYVTFITKLNPAFTEFLVRRKNFINLALKYQEGTVYERMAVKSKDFLNLKIYLPNSSRDINHIAQILQSLDTLVSLNKNKVSLITLIKKELLNTMFI